MEQRDYLMVQIEELGRVLTNLIAEMRGLKTKGLIIEELEIANRTFKIEFGFDFQKLLEISPAKIMATLQSRENFNAENLEKLAEIFLLLAENEQEKNKNNLLEKSLTIYQYLEQNEQDYSMKRHWKIEQIKKVLYFR